MISPARVSGAVCNSYFTLSYLWRLLVFLVALGPGKAYECGGFIGMSSSSTGTIQSPGYPGNYPNYTRCIWILEAPENYVSRLTVDFEGESYNSACSDYVEFRDGGQTGDIIQTTCGNLTSSVVSSTGRWMYVFFSSDGFSQADGLSATYSAVYVGSAVNNNISSPIRSCKTYEFECSNKLCISLSYRCDGFYDCGCGSDCDEDGCGGLFLNRLEQLAIGASVGAVLFLASATFGRLLEKQHNWEKERGQGQTESAPRRQGWTSAKKDKANTGCPPQSTDPPSPRITSCTIQVSEIA